jgi:hypothetical protein
MLTPPDPNLTTDDVLEALRASGKPLHEWGRAIDGTPMLAARTGGDKQPAIFITAGAHAIENGGVHAALGLLERLDTEHEVHVLPLRDPFGFAGVNHCLSFAAGHTVKVLNHDSVLDYLLVHGQQVWHEGDLYLFKLGDLGFIWNILKPGHESFWDMFDLVGQLARDDPEVLKPLWGKSVMFVNPMVYAEGDGEMLRCWHHVLSAKGDSLHLNRFFGRHDAPPEVAAVDRLMQTVRPGLTCDLHEGHGEGFWMPMRKPKENPERVFEMTRAFFDYIHARGYPITTYENWLATDETGHGQSWMRPEPRLPGMFWTRGLQRGEGPNLMDYALNFGIGYGTEGPIHRPLAMRVDGITNGIIAAIKVWEQMV